MLSGSNEDSSKGIGVTGSASDDAENSTLAATEEVGTLASGVTVTESQTSAKGWRKSALLQLASGNLIAVIIEGDAGSIESLTRVCRTSSDSIDGA